jgi:hypothetical protein
MHLYEHEHQLTEQYGDWTWTKSPFYAKTKAQLQEITVCNEIAVSPSKLDKSADYLTDEQFDALHEHTWKLGEDLNLPFSQRILHKQAYFIQGTALFECLRGRDEIANCLIQEFDILDHEYISFQMKRKFKSHKLTSDFSVKHKPSLLINPGKPNHHNGLVFESFADSFSSPRVCPRRKIKHQSE